MLVDRLEWFHVALPLKKPIKHASFERSTSDSFVVRATLADGTIGHGEGVPRSYVTGETIASAFEMIASCDVVAAVGSPRSFGEAVDRLEDWTLPSIEADERGMRGNAARCAVELALLDAFGRHFGASVSEAIRRVAKGEPYLRPAPGTVRYSGAVTADSPRKERVAAWKMRLYGFAHVKVKVGVDGQDDEARLRRLRRIVGPGMDLRLDANEAWTADQLLDRVAPLRAHNPSAIEQPLPHGELDALAELRPKLGVPVMLDESLCGLPDAERAVEGGLADLFNVRVSKCGGLLPTLKIIALAHRSGIGLQLGCHPGESGLLSAAGRHLASNVSNLAYVEGSYDRHILGSNLTAVDVRFGFGGRAGPIGGPGLGVAVDPDRLERMCVQRSEIPHD